MQHYQNITYTNNLAAIQMGLVGKVDIIDLAILDYFLSWSHNEKRQKKEFNGVEYFWVDLSYAVSAMPLLGMKTKQAMSLHVIKLRKANLIRTFHEKETKRLFVRVTELGHRLGVKPKWAADKIEDDPVLKTRGEMPDVKDISDVSEDSDTDESPFVNELEDETASSSEINELSTEPKKSSIKMDINNSPDNNIPVITKDLSNQKHTTNLTTSSKFTLKNLDSENKQNSTIPVNKNGQSSTDFDIDAAFEELWKAYPSRTGKKQAKRHFVTSVKSKEDYERIRKALGNYKRSERVLRGYVMNGSTWFNNWQDWEQPTQAMMKSPKKTSYQFQEPPIDYVRQIEQFGGM